MFDQRSSLSARVVGDSLEKIARTLTLFRNGFAENLHNGFHAWLTKYRIS